MTDSNITPPPPGWTDDRVALVGNDGQVIEIFKPDEWNGVYHEIPQVDTKTDQSRP